MKLAIDSLRREWDAINASIGRDEEAIASAKRDVSMFEIQRSQRIQYLSELERAIEALGG